MKTPYTVVKRTGLTDAERYELGSMLSETFRIVSEKSFLRGELTYHRVGPFHLAGKGVSYAKDRAFWDLSFAVNIVRNALLQMPHAKLVPLSSILRKSVCC